jgi:glycosidase
MPQRRALVRFGLCALALVGAGTSFASGIDWRREVFYQIFPNSFRDSNGDRVGDFDGIRSELVYLKSLGVTTLMINPIFKSRFYHRYFADDFYHVAPAYGTNEKFFRLVRAAHRVGLKVVLDMETQYVSDRHTWYVQGKAHPNSVVGRYLWNSGGLYTRAPLGGFDGQQIRISALDPANPAVERQIEKVFDFWTAPKGDLASGVDGFRIDHMMDDFDWQHVKTGLLTRLWKPIIQSVRQIRPGAFFVGEQSDWGLGTDLFQKAEVNAVFGFPVRTAFVARDAEKTSAAIRDEAASLPANGTMLNFVENHDTERYASVVSSNPEALRAGAVLALTLPGTPSIYQGQELGMKGIQLHGKTDGNDIPVRLAFRWNATLSAPGTPTWYRGDGPWWNFRHSADHDGISVEEESPKPGSLLNFYKRLIRLRKESAALQDGGLELIPTTTPSVVTYLRTSPDGKERVLVALNLSKSAAHAEILARASGFSPLAGPKPSVTPGGCALDLPAWGSAIVRLR